MAHKATTPENPARLEGMRYAECDGLIHVELCDAAGAPRHRYVFPSEWMLFMGDHITAELRDRSLRLTAAA